MNKRSIFIFVSLIIGCFIQSGWSQKKELEDKRTYFAKTYLNEDGTYSVVVSAGPIHYRSEDGKFKEIKRNITPAKAKNYSYEVTEGLYHAYFKSNIKEEYPVVFETQGGAKLEFGLIALAYMDDRSKKYQIIEQAKPVVPKIQGSEIIFSNIFNQSELKYKYQDTRIEEILIFSQKAREALPDPKKYGFDKKDTYLMLLTKLNLKGTLPAYVATDTQVKEQPCETYESIYFKNINGEVKFFMPPDYAYLDKDVKGDSIEVLESNIMKRRFIFEQDGEYLLSGIPLKWIEDQPKGNILFDPWIEVTFQPDGVRGKDAWICSNSSYQSNNAGNSYRLQVENTASTAYRTLLKFTELESYIPAGATIQTALCSLKCYSPVSCGNVLELHQVNHSWLEGSGTSFMGDLNNSTINGVTWRERWFGNNANDGNTPFNNADPDWQTPGGASPGDYDSNIIDGLKSASSGNWTVWNVTALVQSWLNQTAENHGMIILRNDTGTYIRFNSSECGTATERPKLFVKYQLTVPLTTYYIRDAAGNVIAIYKK